MQTRLRAHAYRCAGLYRALLVTLLPLTAMCGDANDSRRVADRFMQLYYGESRPADAVELCAGAAKARLDGELAAMRGMAAAGAGEKPRVTFRLRSASAAAGQATYAYDVDPRTSDVARLTATLVVSGEGERWLVTSIVETEGGS